MTPELAFWKRHGFVIAGVGLPLLLVIALLAARGIPRLVVDDPLYEVVYAIDDAYDGYDANDRRVQELKVDHGRLVVRWSLAETPGYQPRRRVFRADVVRGQVVELAVPEPDEDALEAQGGRIESAVEGLDGVRLDTQAVSPDGYSFSSAYAGGRGLFGELFAPSSRGTRTRIEKEGRVLDVPQLTTRRYYGAVGFLGWAVPEEQGQ